MPDGSLQNIAAVLFPPMTRFKLVENEVTLICRVQLYKKTESSYSLDSPSLPRSVITQQFHKTDYIFSPRYLCSHHPTGLVYRSSQCQGRQGNSCQ